jgi:anti-anti-sigma factor
MSIAETLQVTSQGLLTTITLDEDNLNQVGAGQNISTHLREMAEDEELLRRSIQLNLDLKRIDRITSAGLNELIGINSLARSRGIRVVLLDVQVSVREIFALTRLERMFEFRCSAATA